MLKRHAGGFTLVEVLISIFVLSVGIIGAAGMQLVALRTSQQSAFQTMAFQLASEIADKMRVNSSQMKLDDNANPFLHIDYQSGVDSDPEVPGTACYGTAATCDAEELAAFDIYEWKKRVKAVLPKGRVLVCRDASPWDSSANGYTWACNASVSSNASLVIKLGWQEKNPDGSLAQDPNTSFPPIVAVTVAPYIK